MSVRWSWVGTLCLVACSFDTADPTAATPTPSADTSGGEASSTNEPSSGGQGSTSASGESSQPSTATSSDETSDTVGDETGDVEVESRCPRPLPESWVFCEDFEDVNDLATDFSGISGSGLGVGGPGYQSPEALEITHFAEQDWSGELRIRFGEGPQADNTTEPDRQFDEVWVRMRFRADEGWPVRGPGDLLSIDGVEQNPGWGATFKARISAGQNESSVRNSAFTCVFQGEHACTGTDDWELLDYLGGELGQVPVFDEPLAQQWHCAVVHARLNTGGNSDGLLEVVIDGESDASLTGLDFRGWRSDLGFNLISIPTFMQTPLQDDHRRYIDDVVISTEALGCE